MEIFSVDYWPIWVVAVVMAVAAVVNYWSLNLRNNLTMPFFVGGVALGLAHNLGFGPDAGIGGIAAAIGCAVIGAILLFVAYSAGALGAGSVKLQMGFGAWVGAVYGFERGLYLAGIASIVVAGCIAIHGSVAFLLERRQKHEGMTRWHRWHRLPTGPGQFIGSIGTLLAAHLCHYL